MKLIDNDVVFALSSKGQEVLLHRTVILPTEVRFMMTLINGQRDIKTLRLVCPAAKNDDAAFIAMLDMDLLEVVQGNLPDALKSLMLTSTFQPEEVNTASFASIFDDQQQFITEPSVEILIRQDVLFVQPRVQSNISDVASAAIEDASPLVQTQKTEVSAHDRSVVEQIIRRTLGDDCAPALQQLAEKTDYTAFVPAVQRLEEILREVVSAHEADKLRQQFPSYFN